MKKLQFLFTLLISFIISAGSCDLFACSNVLVTKGASADGSNMISYSADSHALYGEMYFLKAANWPEGALRQVYDWDTGKYLGTIPQVRHTYQRTGNMNEHQLIIAETTYGGRSELWDSTGVVDYGSLIYIALERAKTAREAIKVIADLAQEHGYYSSGESFSIADKDEVWVMELIGKGLKMENGVNQRKGIVWVARRIPDGYICSHANQARISTFPLNDPENCMYSEDVISFAREMGYFDGKDEEFSFCDAYAPLDFLAMRACEARAWSALNILSEGKFTFEDENGQLVTRDAYDYIDYAMGFDKTKRFPLFVKPAKKITVKDIADVMRDHYEGTPMDMTTDLGAGGNKLPYRWRPMTWEYDGKEYLNERAIATQQTGFWFVGQSRGWLPDEIGSLVWFGCDDAATSYLTPVYVNTVEVPECFRVGNGNMLTYSPTSAFWMCNRVANACYKMYDVMQPYVKAKYDAWENAKMEEIPQIDQEALKLYNEALESPRKMIARCKRHKKVEDPYAKVKNFLTDYSLAAANDIFTQWTSLEIELLVKYIDGNIKGQNEDGTFIQSEYKEGVPGKISNLPYSEKFRAAIVEDNGEILEMR